MPTPFPIVASPISVYVAPVGESFPIIEATPSGNWALIGADGDRSYDESGVTIEHADVVEEIRTLGSTGPRKVFRTEESLKIRFIVLDLTLETYRLVLNSNTVTDTAAGSGLAGFREVEMYRGTGVSQVALLIRGSVSPYGDDFNIQFQLPNVFQIGSPEAVFQKGVPVGLAFEYVAVEDPSAASAAERFGKIVMQDEVVT